MSTIKTFGLAGVSADVQFGKSGPRLIQTAGAFSLKNAAASAFTTLDVAAPTTDDHATNRLFVNTGLGATRTGAGLNTDGSYTANASANYLAAATSLKDADNKLDFNLKSVSTSLTTTNTGAGLNAGGTYTANATGNYVNGATSLKNADNKLDFALFLTQSEVNTIETAAGLNTDGTLPTWSATNYVTGTTSLYNAIKALDTQAKTTSDTITAMGSVFNYVGTLTGGAVIGTPFDLATLSASGKNPGDYYKVTTAGYFTFPTPGTFYANVGDGIVFNTASGVDVIDNTNSTISGTSNRITITGSVDAGFAADIANTYVGQTSITTLGTIGTGTWAASTITADRGGTGFATYAAGDILYASGTTTLSKLAKGTALQFLRMNSGATAPEYATLNATVVPFSNGSFSATDVSGALIELKGQISSLTGSAIQSPDTNTSVSTSDTLGVQFYDEVSATKTEILRLTGSTTAATLATQGAGSNIDLILDPKGTGAVNVSSSKVINLSNATAATDALPLGQGKSIFSAYAVADITEANANVVIGGINGVVLRIIVYLSAGFAGGSTLTVGYSGSQSALAAAADIEHTAAGIYVINNISVINQTVTAYITGTGSGAGKVIVEYLAA